MKRIFALLIAALVATLAQAQTVKIGSTLALTGPLSATGMIHKVAGEIYVEEMNMRGGLLGRKVEWVLKDDQSRPDLARTLYEQLVTVDKVDLLIGPYATANILAAIGVAQRYNKLILHHTAGVPQLIKYDLQFPTGGLPADPEVSLPELVFNAVAQAPKPPKTVAIVTTKFPSAHSIALGAREVAKKRGLTEVLFLEYEFGNRDFGAIAARVKDAKPDFVFAGALGLDGVLLLDAMKKIDYQPPMHFYTFPAPGPMLKLPEAKNALALTTFEEHPPHTGNPQATQFIQGFRERAAKASLPSTSVDLLSTIAYASWQVLEAAVSGARSLDDKALAQWLRQSQVDTVMGRLSWQGTPEGPPNFVMGKDIYKVKQLQDGKWLVVWPKEFAAPGAKLIGP